MAVEADYHSRDALAHVLQAGGQRQDGHQFTGDGDLKIRLQFKAFFFRALPNGYATQHTVVHVYSAPPGDGCRVNIQPGKTRFLLGAEFIRIALGDAEPFQAANHPPGELALTVLVWRAKPVKKCAVRLRCLMEHARINGSCQQVVGSCNGMDIASEVQIKIFHRDNLRVAAAGCSALDAKGRALRRLPDAGEDALIEMSAESLAQANRGCGFALSQRRRGDGGHVDILAIWHVRQPIEHFQFDFRLVIAVKFDFFRQQADLFSQLADRFQLG